jgi:hypothetical protein
MKSTSTFLKAIYNLFVVFGVCHISLFFGCSGEPDVTLEPEDTAEDTETGTDAEVLYAQTFKALQQTYPSPILDDRFETLHRMRSDPTYFAFLRSVYPDVLHQDLKTFVKNSPPDAEVYEVVLHKHFGEPTKTDIVVVHRLHQIFQKARISIYHGTDQRAAEGKIIIPAMQEEPIWGWFVKHARGNEEGFDAFDADFQRLSRDIEFGNIIRLNKILMDQSNERRRDDRFIWLMLQEPVLMGEVLDSFTDTEIFLEWLKGKFQKPEIRF